MDARAAEVPGRRRGLGAWAPLLGGIGFGAAVPLSKQWLGGGVPRWIASGWVYATAGVGLFLLRRLWPARGERPLERADVPWLAAAIVLGGVLAPFALFTGLDRTPSSLASLLLNGEVVFTAVLAVALFRERLDGWRVVGVALVVLGSAGTFLVERGREEAGVAGEGGGAWIVAACFLWALDNNVTRRIAHKDPMQIAAWKGLGGGAVSLAVAALRRDPWPTGLAPLLGGAAIGFVAYGLSLCLFALGLRTVGAARTAALFGVHPFVGVVAAVLVLGEPLTLHVVGLALVLAAGVALLVLEPPAPSPAPGAPPPGVP